MTRVPPSEQTREQIEQLVSEPRSGGDDVLSHLIRLGMQRIMEEAMEGGVRDLLGSRGYYERRGPDQQGYRNGYRRGRLKSSEGEIGYSVPKVRGVAADALQELRSLFAGRTGELERLAVETFARGCSTRDVEELFRSTDGSPIDMEKIGQRTQSYGTTPGQLGAMPSGSVDAVVSSPPYEGSVNSQQHGIDWEKAGPATGNRKRGDGTKHEETLNAQLNYGAAEGQLGNETGTTFWSAARQIVAECHAILKPGGVAVWVCKDFVRNKQRIPFSADWVRLCESQGFRLVEWIEASLVKTDSHPSLFGGQETKTTERKSFFRRLAEKKGSPRIDHEDVLVLERLPVGNKAGGEVEAVVGSPPYASSEQSRDADFTLQSTNVNPTPRNLATRTYFPANMTTPGQLAAMKPGSLDDYLR